MHDAPESPELEPRVIKAGNSGAFTLDGTRTFLVGKNEVAVIDPGPDVESHVRALVSALEDASRVRILLTHHHGDHAASAGTLGQVLNAPVFGPPSTDFQELTSGQRVSTDQGDLEVLGIPGHTRDHLGFHWPRARALFVGDLILGRGTTTWLGEYEGCVADYLDSLRRVEEMNIETLYPAHGAPVHNPSQVIASYRGHRLTRLEQLEKALALKPDPSMDTLLESVYGRRLPERMRKAAEASIRVMIHHLRPS